MANWGSYGYICLWLPGVGSTEETRAASRYMSALPNFEAHPICLPLAELEGKMPLAADEVLIYPRRRRYIIKNGRPMAAPTIIDFSAAKVGTCGTDKSVFSVAFLRRANTVIASARPGTTGKTITSGTGKPVPYGYRFQCRQNRDNQAINDRPYGCTAEFNTALMCGGSFPVSSVTSTPGSRNMRIGSCVKAPLKKRGSHGFARTLEPGHQR